MLAGGSPVSVYRSEDGGESWKKLPDPALPVRAKMPFACRVMRFAPHPSKAGEIFAVLEVSRRDALDRRRRELERLQRAPGQAVGAGAAAALQARQRHRGRGHARRPRHLHQRGRSGRRHHRGAHGPVPQQATRARPGAICASTASRRSPTAATSASRRRTRRRSMRVSASRRRRRTARCSADQDVGQTWQRFDKVQPHGTLMSVTPASDRRQAGLCRRALRRGVRHAGRRRDLARDAAAAGHPAHLRLGCG